MFRPIRIIRCSRGFGFGLEDTPGLFPVGGKYRNISPLASEKFYNIPGIKQVMQAVGTIPIADASVSSGVPDFSQVYQNITQAL